MVFTDFRENQSGVLWHAEALISLLRAVLGLEFLPVCRAIKGRGETWEANTKIDPRDLFLKNWLSAKSGSLLEGWQLSPSLLELKLRAGVVSFLC